MYDKIFIFTPSYIWEVKIYSPRDTPCGGYLHDFAPEEDLPPCYPMIHKHQRVPSLLPKRKQKEGGREGERDLPRI